MAASYSSQVIPASSHGVMVSDGAIELLEAVVAARDFGRDPMVLGLVDGRMVEGEGSGNCDERRERCSP